MGTLNKIIALLFLFPLYNINHLHAQCEVILNNGIVHIDSIIGENSMDINMEYVITDNETIIFITLINELYPNIKPFTRRNIDHAIVTTMEEITVLASFLSEDKSAILKGRAEGEHNKAVDIAKKLLASGLDVDFVAKSTGLPAAELRSIL